MRPFFPCLILFWLTAGLPAAAKLNAVLESNYIVPGETTALTISIASPASPVGRPELPELPNISFGRPQTGARVIRTANTRETIHFFQYPVRSFREGTHTIPPIEISVGGVPMRTRPLTLVVRPLDSIAWRDGDIAGNKIRYGSAVFVPAVEPHVGETFPAEVKMYLPVDSVLSEKGYAELEHDGLTAWRFEPAGAVGSASLPLGTYSVVTFRSAASPLRAGEVTLGPGTARMAFQIRPRSGIGFSFRNVSGAFTVPQVKLTTRALPEGAPPGFEGAVGRFSLQASAETADLEEGDPIAVRLRVEGTGNLDTLKIPALTGRAADWKTYEPSRLERQGERRSASGEVSFSQIIRPLTPQSEIPPFRLVFFNPAAKQYETITTEPIAFTARPASTPGNAVSVIAAAENPTRDMQGILGLVDPLRPQPRAYQWTKYWHAVPAALLFLLLLKLAWNHLARRQTQPTTTRDALVALDRVTKSGSDAREFLRAAGHYIEEWIPASQRDEELTGILKRRDEESFRPPGEDTSLSGKERSQLLATIKSRVMNALAILFLLAMIPPAGGTEIGALYQEAATNWEKGNYDEARQNFRKAHPGGVLPADVEYNLGNCHFRLGEPGLAALHYHRALLSHPGHREAGQNLSFLRKRLGTVQPRVTNWRETLALWIRTHALTLAQIGMWTVALTVTALLALNSFLPRLLAWICLPAGSLVFIVAGITYFTVELRFTDFTHAEELAVITTSANAIVRTEPIGGPQSSPQDLSPVVMATPPGTLCRPLAERGPWTYLELPDFTRGWLPSENLAPLVPPPTEASVAPKELL